jgi:hypothetical protein
MQDVLLAMIWTVGMSVWGALKTTDSLYRAEGGDRADPVWLYLASGAAWLLAVALLSRSRTVHLEMPTDAGALRVRDRLKGQRLGRRRWAAYLPKFAALKASMSGVGSRATYWVWCHPDDAPISNLISNPCELAGWEKDEINPGLVFVVVTTRTPDEIVRSALAIFGYRAVFVLATSLRLPDDELRRHQWLDFRDQEPEGLYDLLRTALHGPGERGVVTAPVGVDTFRAPGYVTNYLLIGQTWLGFVAAPPLGLILAGQVSRAVPVGLVTLLLAATMISLMRRTASRTVTSGWWSIGSLAVLLLFVGWLVLLPPIPMFPLLNRVVLFMLVALHLFGLAGTMLAVWLPPDHPEQKTELASAPVRPPRYSFFVPLMTLALATGYLVLTQAGPPAL